MKMGKWVLAAAAPLLTCWLSGCGDFWQAPTSTSSSFALTNSGNLTVTPGASIGNTSTITVTPANSFTGTVDLSCAVTPPSGASNATTCSLSPTSVDISSTTALTSVLTATTSSSTTAGAYQIAVTGVSGSVAATTSVCVEVSSSTSASCSSGSTTSGVFYVLNQTTDQIVALSISSGKLNTIGAVTLQAAHPYAIAVAPNDQFLYVSTPIGVYLYTIGSNGALTLGNGGTRISSDPATTMLVDATNSWLVEAISGSTQLGALNVVSTGTNAGTLVSTTAQLFTGGLPASTVTQLAISPGDSSSCGSCYLFVGMGTGGTEIINFNPANSNPFGNSGHINLLNSGGGDNAVAVDPTNRLLYIGESDALPSATQSGGLRVFTISSAGVTPLAGSPYASGGIGPSSIQPTADGNYVYIANLSVSGSSDDNIAGFSVTSTALTSIGSAVTAGPTGQIGLAQDSTGSFLLAVDFAGNPDLEAYTISSGTLTSILSVATGTDPVGAVAIAAAP